MINRAHPLAHAGDANGRGATAHKPKGDQRAMADESERP